MTHATATQHAAATASSFRLRSRTPRSMLRKKPLSKKKSTTLMELFTPSAYQNLERAETRNAVNPAGQNRGPSDTVAVASMVPPQLGSGATRSREGSR